MLRRLVLCLTILLFSATSFAANKRPFTIEELYRLKSVSDIRLSPNGKQLAYVVTSSDFPRAKRVSQIWLMDSDGRNARQLTKHEKGAYSPLFSPDGKWLSFVSSQDGSANLYLLPVAGGNAKKLTSISTGVSDPLWSPDGKWLAFATDVYPECGANDACNKKIAERWEKGPVKAHMADELLYRHWNAWKDGTRTHTFLVNVASGQLRDLTPGDVDAPTFQVGGPRQYDFSPDSAEFVYVSKPDKDRASSTNNDLWLLSLTTPAAKPRNITAANPAYDGSPKYSPDGRYIAYRVQKQPGYESDLVRLALYDRTAGRTTIVTEAFRNWVEEFDWAKDSRSIFFAGLVEAQNPIFQFELATGRITEVLRDKTIDAFVLGPDDERLVYIKRSVNEPSEIYSATLGQGQAASPVRLTHLNDAVVNEVDIRPAESMWVKGADGANIHVFVVKPHNFDPSKKYPLILNVHGGPQSHWGDAFRGDWQIYPGAGYVVAFPNPHGSTSYGQEFTEQISGDWGGKVFEDLMKVTDALERLPYVDRERMGAMGWSYGGYMMMWFEGHTDRFKALAAMMGIYDLPSFYGATEELWFPEWDLKGQPWNSKLYEKWSPSNYVKNFKTPCLVIAGERDYRVPYTQSLQFFTALQKMKVPSRLIVYANAGHWPSWYEMALYYTAHLEWFHQYLKGEPPPWTTEQFLRNAVFDSATGKRISIDEAQGDSLTRPPAQRAPRNRPGKPDRKPRP